ncbi:MAG: 4Fe-4S binding protein [Dehalococcoidales bacterium]|jgi:ferredoxin|nr:4Fe-4S binding protein [Dehalococcoidales bacterium]
MSENNKTSKRTVARKIVLHFPRRMVDEPILFHLTKDYDLEFNILKASITPEAEGLMVVELKGDQHNYDQGIQYLIDRGVRIQSLSQDVTRNEERCTSCGACVTVCPAGAFEVDPVTRIVKFNDAKCIACGLCIKACPPRAMELHF